MLGRIHKPQVHECVAANESLNLAHLGSASSSPFSFPALNHRNNRAALYLESEVNYGSWFHFSKVRS